MDQGKTAGRDDTAVAVVLPPRRNPGGNGAITISGGGNDVQAATGNGRILVLNTTGRVQASTGNGRITVEGARGPVDASTGSGDITTAIPIRLIGRATCSRLRATLGDGGDRLALSTGSGNITIQKSRQDLRAAHTPEIGAASWRSRMTICWTDPAVRCDT
jgi:DUF4097 and DUF4098 domain-containing protein YvlB